MLCSKLMNKMKRHMLVEVHASGKLEPQASKEATTHHCSRVHVWSDGRKHHTRTPAMQAHAT